MNDTAGMLVDNEIRYLSEECNLIIPFDEKSLQPSSYDLHLDDTFITYDSSNGNAYLEPYAETGFHHIIQREHKVKQKFELEPGMFCLASTKETLNVGSWFAARFEGKSTLGRYGLQTHMTAGFIDPGFHGQITVELHNVSGYPIVLNVGIPIGQVCFYPLGAKPDHLYGDMRIGSHYQGQKGPTAPR